MARMASMLGYAGWCENILRYTLSQAEYVWKAALRDALVINRHAWRLNIRDSRNHEGYSRVAEAGTSTRHVIFV